MNQKLFILTVIGVWAAGSTGCAVPQPPGRGTYTRVTEPTTKAKYHLYLPVDYVKNNGRHPNPRMTAWPLVMTFHGMKPYDTAHSQEREWEQEADIYGYVVCAPELKTSNSFMEYPLTKEHDYVLKDKQNVVAIMDHVFQTTNADRRRVLSTSWSCGGYLAHYFQNRFPDRFSCLATRLSNFSSSLLSEENLPLYKDRVPVAIFIGDGDFPACKSESEQAVAYYEAHGFRTVRGKMIDNIGHARIPQTAAAFFAEQLGIEPLHPLEAARTVSQVRMTEYYPPQDLIARFTAKPASSTTTLARADSTISDRSTLPSQVRSSETSGGRTQPLSSFTSTGAGRNYPDRTPAYEQSSAVTGKTDDSRVADADRPRDSIVNSKSADSDRNDTRSANASIVNQRNPGSGGRVPAATPWKASEPETPALASRTPREKNTVKSSKTSAEAERLSVPAPVRASYGVTPSGGLPSASRAPSALPAGGSRGTSPPTRVNRVNIRFNGPAVGTSPHFLEYSVDLPPEKMSGADFLWMDNGVWMGNDSSGKKILQSPGLHQISVLIVTRDDVEYRGSATVQVLEPGPGGGAY